MMDSVGHYSRPELLSLLIDRRQTQVLHERPDTTKESTLNIEAHYSKV
jgi:nitrilase